MDKPSDNARQISPESSDSDDATSLDYYKSKVSNLMALMLHYQKAVKREQGKNDGFQLVNESLQESRQQIQQLSQRLSKKDSIIAVLQNRLAFLGASTDVELSSGEMIVLPSRENFDRIIEENMQLKRNLRYTSFDPKGYEHLQQQIRTLQNDLHELNANHKRLQAEHDNLKKTLESSNDEKDEEIALLRRKLEDAETNTNIHAILCQSLTTESKTLKQELQQADRHCLQLEERLRKQASQRQDIIQLQKIDGTDGPEDEASSSKVLTTDVLLNFTLFMMYSA